MSNQKKANKVKCQQVVKNLEKRGMAGYYCENSREASEKVLELIPDGALVSWGGSATLDEIDVKDRLQLVNAKILDPMSYKNPEEVYRARVNALSSDVFLTGTNAITLEGELVNIDGTGNRVAALCFGPGKVIVVAGVNKIVRDETSAVARVKTEACIANSNSSRSKNAVCSNRPMYQLFDSGGDHLFHDCGHKILQQTGSNSCDLGQ